MQALLSMWLPPGTAPIAGTRNHAYQPLFTALGIIDRLPPARSNIFIHELRGPGGSAVPGRGLEPLWISPPDPKSGASANFATLANT